MKIKRFLCPSLAGGRTRKALCGAEIAFSRGQGNGRARVLYVGHFIGHKTTGSRPYTPRPFWVRELRVSFQIINWDLEVIPT